MLVLSRYILPGSGKRAEGMPVELRVLKSSKPKDRSLWLDAWNAWPGKELFAHPTYLEVFAGSTDEACCAMIQGTEGHLLFPFILRNLSALEWYQDSGPAWDLIGPYGYGGIFTHRVPPADYQAFWEQLSEWLAANHVVTSFIRLSLFPGQIGALPFTVKPVAHNIVRSLDLDPAECWKDYEHKVRKNVTRARERGLVVEVDRSGRRLEAFLAVYGRTMRRREASESYSFGPAFYDRLIRECGDNLSFFHVLDEDRVVSSELVLLSDDYAYSFLGGTIDEYFPARANDLLKHEIIEWTRNAGKKAFVLGGGYKPGDGIFKYKRSFAPNGQVAFSVAQCIHDEERCRRLVEDRRAWEAARGRHWEPGEAYFPPYRS